MHQFTAVNIRYGSGTDSCTAAISTPFHHLVGAQSSVAGTSRGRTPAPRRSLGNFNRRAGRAPAIGTAWGFAILCGEETRCYVMSYVERILQPGEQIRHISSIHWIVYWAGVGVTLLAAIAYWLSETRLLTRFWLYTAFALALVAVVLLVQEWFTWWVTEIAVTNRRVIYKKGFIRRRTNEMNMDKVESVQVDQSILGRMLDHGTVTILSTGEGFATLWTIASPVKLRNCITGN
jgi:Bacterial PH domain